jgi:hypothetical protein
MATTKPLHCEQPSASIHTCHDGNFQVKEHLDIFARDIYVPGEKDGSRRCSRSSAFAGDRALRCATLRATCGYGLEIVEMSTVASGITASVSPHPGA